MRLGEPTDELRFAIGLRPALFELGKVLEEVSEQIRVAGTGLIEGSVDNVRHVLREREFRALDVAHERGEVRELLS